MEWLTRSGSSLRSLTSSGGDRHDIKFTTAAHPLLVMAPWLPITKAAAGTSVSVPYAAVSPLGWAMFLYNPDHWSAVSVVSDSILSPEAINKALASAIAAGLSAKPYGSWGHMVNALQDFAVSHPSIPELWLSEIDIESIEHGTVAMQPDESYDFLADIQLREMARRSRSMAGMALFEVLSAPRLSPASRFKADHPMGHGCQRCRSRRHLRQHGRTHQAQDRSRRSR